MAMPTERASVSVTWTIPTDSSVYVPDDWKFPGLLRYIRDSLKELMRGYAALAYGYRPAAQALGRFRLGFTLTLVGVVMGPALVVRWGLRRQRMLERAREIREMAGRARERSP